MSVDMSEEAVKKVVAPPPLPEQGPQGGGVGGVIVVVVVLLLLVGGGFGVWQLIARQAAARDADARKQAEAAANRPVPVVAQATRLGSLPIYLNGLGNVMPLQTVTVRTRVDGELMKVEFEEGKMVHAGNELALIDPRPFQAVLEQSQAQKAKDEALKVKDEALKARDEAALANARLDLKRYQEAGEAATQMQRDTADAAVKQDVATVDQDAAAVVQDAASIQADQAQIDSALLNITYCHINSPLTGRIGLRMVDVGNMVHAGDANGMAVITQLQPITVVFTLRQDDLPTIQKAVAAAAKAGGKLPAVAWDREFKVKLGTGTLEAMDNAVDPTTGTVKLKAVYANEDEGLFPSQFVNVRLLVDTRKDVVLAPTAALQRSPSSSYAFVVKEDKTVEMRSVKVGPTEGETAVVEEGLSAGDVVVTDGLDKLQQGTKVTVAGATTQAGGKGRKGEAETMPATQGAGTRRRKSTSDE